MSYKTRRRLSMLALVVGLPAYIVAAVSLVAMFDRPPLVVEFIIYVILGVVWAFVLKPVFKGVGKADPDAPTDE